jgi:hypothetical protein
MTRQASRQAIQDALAALDGGDLRAGASALFDTLGYRSNRQLITNDDPVEFLDFYDRDGRLNRDKALFDDWQSVALLFQLTDDDIRNRGQLALFDSAGVRVDDAIIESYLFVAVDLRGEGYSRTQLARITREFNRLFPMPVMVLYRYRNRVSERNPVSTALTLAVINRRLHRRDSAKDVLEKVTLIKDIRAARPHRAHIEILDDLSLDRLAADDGVTNFVELHRAWQKALDSSELNKRFFREIADWYFWAVSEVIFPAGAGPDETRNPTGVIRLLTRLIFVWFLKEKGLVPDELFSKRALDGLLTWDDPQGSAFYKAILQNLFFATLNQEMGDGRRFRGRNPDGRDQHYGVANVYRYERYFTDPGRALELFAGIPFLNGGLFECLDRPAEGLRVDGFSDRADNPLRVPDELFFGDERDIDLNPVYDTTNKRYRVRGLIRILDRYKFTIDENTPIEEEIALDPELLGKVFENLLAAYNPETGTTARKATGSFYTPREIVNYMVDEALLAYLESAVPVRSSDFNRSQDVTEVTTSNHADRLRRLLAYNDEAHNLNESEVEALIAAIDRANILDPACGSGAFPMGILHKLVFVLGKLDPGNERWKERQLAPLRRMLAEAETIDDAGIRRQTIHDLERRIEAVEQAFARNELDYGRKLYLIENCIYGVDIQPIAVQIAKLRFFISLVVDQRIGLAANRGILPLPNLETKFVAANTLLGVERQKDEHSGVAMGLQSGEIVRKREELKEVRHRYFTARTPATKEKYRQRDAELRRDITAGLQLTGLGDDTVRQLAGWDPYDQNTHAEFFDPEWMFGLREGFDIVIGNPPYGFRNVLSATEKKHFRKKLGYVFPTGDIAELFVLQGIYLLTKANGCCTFIIPKKSLYGERWLNVRRLWQEVELFFLMDASQAFESVLLEQAAFLIQKSEPVKKSVTVGSLDSESSSVKVFGRFQVTDIFTEDLKNAQIYRGLYPISLRNKLRDRELIVPGTNLVKAKIGISNITKYLTNTPNGNYPCIKGIDIAPYVLKNKDRYLLGTVAQRYIKEFQGDKLVAQEIIAHIQNPIPHIQIAIFLDDEQRLIHDTCVEIMVTDPRLSKYSKGL